MGANPITPEVFVAYRVFVAEQQREFRRISAATKGEHSAEDVSQEALLTACALQADRGMAMRFADASYRKLQLQFAFVNGPTLWQSDSLVIAVPSANRETRS